MSFFKRRIVWIGLAAGAVAAGVLIAAWHLPFEQRLGQFTGWIQEQGPAGKLYYVAAYVLGTVLCLWGALFTVAGGIAFGLWWGAVLALASATTGAALAFLMGRYVARGAVERYLARRGKLAAVDRAIGRHGWKIVVLVRLNPLIPFNASNYVFGLTRIKFWPYLLATAVAISPGTFIYAYLGYIGRVTLLDARTSLGRADAAILVGGLILTVAAAVYLSHLARQAWRQAEDELR